MIYVYAGIAQLARASAFQAEGREFESRFPLHLYLCCGRSSAVEHNLAKVRVDGSIPFARSILLDIKTSSFHTSIKKLNEYKYQYSIKEKLWHNHKKMKKQLFKNLT